MAHKNLKPPTPRNNRNSGLPPRTRPKTVRCPHCDGLGHIWDRFTHRAFMCFECDGTGKIYPHQQTPGDSVEDAPL